LFLIELQAVLSRNIHDMSENGKEQKPEQNRNNCDYTTTISIPFLFKIATK